MKNFNKAKKKVNKYSVLNLNILYLRDNSFLKKISIPERYFIINLSFIIFINKPDFIFSLFLSLDLLKLIAQHINLYINVKRLL